MSFFRFIKNLFEPSPKQLQKEKERHMRHVLLVMAERRCANLDDTPSLYNIHRYLLGYGWAVPPITLIDTLNDLIEKGFIQRLDGGDKTLDPAKGAYVISGNGLNHLGLYGIIK